MSSILPHLILGFQGITSKDPGVIAIKELIGRGLGGVILFKNNIDDLSQLKSLTSYLSAGRNDLLIAIDQEGGMVQRLPTETPNAFDIVQKGEDEGRITYQKMAQQLKKHGINWNFAPSVDLHRSDSTAIGKWGRSYSTNPDVVIKWAHIFMESHRRAGVLTALKHWPGHGFATGDTHEGLVDVTHSYKPEEEIPFRHLMAYCDSIMVSHVVNRNWDPHGNPMTMSTMAIGGRLRGEQKYNGILVSDDMWMGAIQGHIKTPAHGICQTLTAGCDYAIVSCHSSANTGGGRWSHDLMELMLDLEKIRPHYPALDSCLMQSKSRQVTFLSRLKTGRVNGQSI